MKHKKISEYDLRRIKEHKKFFINSSIWLSFPWIGFILMLSFNTNKTDLFLYSLFLGIWTISYSLMFFKEVSKAFLFLIVPETFLNKEKQNVNK